MVLPDSHRISRVLWYSGYLQSLLGFRLRAYHPVPELFPERFDYLRRSLMEALQPQGGMPPWFGLVRVRSPLLPESLLISFPLGTEMFHFPRLASLHLWIQWRMGSRAATGFPIRTSPGQRLLGTSPELIAASHVLHRLCAPRHPPSALSSLPMFHRSRLGVAPRTLPHRDIRTTPGRSTLNHVKRFLQLENLSLAVVFDCQRTVVSRLELIGIEPTTSGLQSPRSPS
jgi:hypothetical protein